MSHPKPKFTEIDFSSVMQDRRVPLPITHLPVNALTDDTDPTREIRALIEQLQQTSRESRAQQRLAEDERKEIAAQLEGARRQNDELRAHFVEITSLIRERDAAVQEMERQSRTLSEAQSRAAGAEQNCQELRKQCEATGRQRDELARQKEELSRQKDDLGRQKEDLNRRIDAVTHTSLETNRCFNEAQRQMLAIRQARDAATAQNTELAQKLARSEDAIADLEYHVEILQKKVAGANDLGLQVETLRKERDDAVQNAKNSGGELEQVRALVADLTTQINEAVETGKMHESALAEVREAAGAASLERDAFKLELEAKSREAEEFSASLAALAAEKNEILESDRQHEASLFEVREQLEALIGERDALCSDLASKASEIGNLRQRPDGTELAADVEHLQNELRTLQHERSAGDLRVQVLSREVLDLRNELQDREERIASLQRTTQHTESDMEQTQAQFETLVHERDVAKRIRDEAITSLAAAQKQIDKIIRDRDLVRQQGVENSLAMEAQIEALRAQLQVMECSPGAAMGGHADITEMARLLELREHERRDLAERLEQQRAETIDLGAQLHAAQDQIKQLGASFAEARLLAKGAGRNAPPPAIREPMTRNAIAREPIVREPIVRQPIAREPVVPPPLPILIAEPFALAESNELIRSMKRCYQAFMKNSADVSHLNELHCLAHNFAERARTAGLVTLHRLSAAFCGLAHELYHYPEQVNASALRTIWQTIEFLATLLKVKDLTHLRDPATASVYAVDDDADNCDCIRMAMETAMVRTTSSQDPAKAICELAEKPCDLIFLDVNMPGMDGFELCAEIRRLTLHATTPIIFLSGLNSSENRMQSSLSGGNEFVGKPFILCELTVKALTLILKSQLHLA